MYLTGEGGERGTASTMYSRLGMFNYSTANSRQGDIVNSVSIQHEANGWLG